MLLTNLLDKDSCINNSSFIYLDYNATTPPAAEIIYKIPEWLQAWANPSSVYSPARLPKALLRDARMQVSRFFNIHPLEIVFTSGGSEGNNLAIYGAFKAMVAKNPKRRQIISTPVEHPSVSQALFALEANGAKVDFIPISRDGLLDMSAYKELLSEETALVTTMFANNETGTIFPIRYMAELAHKQEALFHTDAVQALGKIPIDLRSLGVDLATFAGHKCYALKGSGCLFVRQGLELIPLIVGGGQERFRRAGTENILAIASFAEMCRVEPLVIENHSRRMKKLREDFENDILNSITNSFIVARKNDRLPNTTNLVIPDVDSETLLINLDMVGFAVSTGSACSSGSARPSPTLVAMGLSDVEARNSLRISIGWPTTEEELKCFSLKLVEIVDRLRTLKK